MKFIVDAHLPMVLVKWLRNKGFDAIHTRELPNKNETEDITIIELSVNEQRVVITKDNDFLEYYWLKGEPHKLIMITTGNIVNKELLMLFERNFELLIELLKDQNIVEMSNDSIVAHS